jgi:hypothetical protein
LRTRLLISLVLSVPVVALAMVPALQFTYWQWLSLGLAAPVVVWGALPCHRATWANARHGVATMDTLISIGVGAAFLWSVYALFFGSAGEPGMRHGFEFAIQRGAGADGIYPKGFHIGHVEVSERGNQLYRLITVRPIADFRALDEVLVVLREPRPANLEQAAPSSAAPVK